MQLSKSMQVRGTSLATIALLQLNAIGPLAPTVQAHEGGRTESPIKHVIVIVGENRSFDHLFATYKPKHGQSIDNLLSKGIVNEDGTPGPNFRRAHQRSADVTGSSMFVLSPKHRTLYDPMPAPLNGGPTDVCADNKICSLADAMSSENGLSATRSIQQK